jgi:hypothetical protein
MRTQYKRFIFGETLRTALNAVPESEQTRFFNIVMDYGLDGTEPVLTGFEKAVWVQMKALIDNLDNVGAPLGNSNAKKNGSEQPEIIGEEHAKN